MAPPHILLKPGEPVTAIGALFYVDLATGATEGWELGVDSVPSAEISPDGRYILYGQRLLDTTTGAVCEPDGILEWAGPFSPDSQRFLAQTREGMASLSSDDCGSEREPLGLPPSGDDWFSNFSSWPSAVWSPNGESLVVWAYAYPPPGGVYRTQRVYLLGSELDAPLAVQVADNRESSSPVGWSPDGKRFALASGSGLTAVDQRGQLLWSTDIPSSAIANARWSPNGASVAVHAFPPFDELEGDLQPSGAPAVYVVDAETGALRFLLWGASACWGEVWTADGGSLIVAGQRSDEFGWFVITADGTSVRRLDAADAAFFVEPSPTNPDIAAFLGRPRYPDGTVGAVEGPLMSLDLTSGEAKPVLRVSPQAQAPGWDPVHSLPRWLSDGRLVFFTGDGGHGGCEMGPARPNLEVQFPPFEADE